MMSQKTTILYSRISRDDELQNESNSITNQRRLLEEYAERNGLTPYENVVDDGYSGTNFNRPGWQELIAKVEAGHVENLLFKDMTRFGRDHLRVGLYLEMFREKKIRVIAVNDGVDTALGEDDFLPFRNIVSEMYARDTSRKVKSVLSAKGRDGKPLGSVPIYGFMKDPEDKNNRLIDPEAAEVVKRIFRMTLDGKGPYQIAKILMDEKVERPSYYLVRRGILKGDGKCNYELRYNWRGTTVMKMLKMCEYKGDLVNFKTSKPSFKSKKQVLNPPEKQVVFEGVLPAIIDRGTWELVQKLRRTVRRPTEYHEPNPLTGILFCADCGEKLHNRRSDYTTDKNGKKITPVDSYECRTYRKNAAKFIDKCSIHFIRSVVARELILDAIRKVSGYARKNEAEFVTKLREASTVKQAETAKAHKRQLAKNERRIAELDVLYRKVYEDSALGKLSDERFEKMSSDYEREQAELKAKNAEVSAELEAFEQDNMRADNFLELVRRYTEFNELTTQMLHEFVDKVLIHEADNSTGERVQQVDIYFNFIGNFIVSGSEPKPLTPEEQAEEEERLAKKREKNRKLREWRAKRKSEIAAEADNKSA